MPISRPILIYGAGIHLAGAEEEALAFARHHQIPVAPTWAGLDLIPSDDPLVVGSFGTHGTRAGNFAVQNSDYILSVGSRLDSKATGTPIETFAREAQIVMVDIDDREIRKFNGRVDGICCDAKDFFQTTAVSPKGDFTAWRTQIARWKERYPVVSPEYEKTDEVNPYVFLRELSSVCEEGEIICSDTGCTVAWVSQAWYWKENQRFIHAFNQTPMGYGLPSAIGAQYATGQRVVLVTGDGSLMMSLGELATAKDLPIKIFLLNNKGHAMCRQTQREWLGGTYPSTSIEGGLKFPHFRNVALACGLKTWVIEHQHKRRKEEDSNKDVIEKALADSGPTFVEIVIDPSWDVVPKVKYGYPNEDGHPLLDRDEFKEQMIVKPWAAT